MPSIDWLFAYELSHDVEHVAALQKASLNESSSGLSPNPLVGGREWWNEIASGRRFTYNLEGTIARVYWASMGDWPEFTIRTPGGNESNWTREGDCRRYVQGLRIRLAYVEHEWKRETKERTSVGDVSKVVLSIEIEPSLLRSSSIAPGPGGAGYDLARRNGDVVHYLIFRTVDEAQRLEPYLHGRIVTIQIRAEPSIGAVFAYAWHRDASRAEQWRAELQQIASKVEATYDGGEVVGGAVWGPSLSSFPS